MSAATFVRMLLSDPLFASLSIKPVDPRMHAALVNRVGPQPAFVRAVSGIRVSGEWPQATDFRF